MGRLRISPATIHDVAHVGANMRADDLRELHAIHGSELGAMELLAQSVSLSAECFALVAPDGSPVAIFGVAPVYPDPLDASPWLLATEEFASYPRDLVVLGRQVVKGWVSKYRRLYNCVDARNTRSVAWLQAIGFEVRAPGPAGRDGELFHLFTRCT